MGTGVTCCADARSLQLATTRADVFAAVVRVRALAVPSMFPRTLGDSLRALPFSVSCVVAPPEALAPQHGITAMGDTLVIVNGRLIGVVPSDAPNVVGAVFSLLRASGRPEFGQTDGRHVEASWDNDDPFEVLGVSPADPFESVRAAWRARLAEYHPDRYTQAGPKIRAVAEDESRRLNAAFARIAAHNSRPRSTND